MGGRAATGAAAGDCFAPAAGRLAAAALGFVTPPFWVRWIVDDGRSADGRGGGGVTRDSLGALLPKSPSALRFAGAGLGRLRPGEAELFAGPPDIWFSKSEI